MRTSAPDMEIVGKILRRTEKAIQVTIKTIDGYEYTGTAAQWFPKGQINSISENDPENGGDDYFCASQWICQQKNLLRELGDAMVAKEQADEVSDAEIHELFPLNDGVTRQSTRRVVDELDDDNIPF